MDRRGTRRTTAEWLREWNVIELYCPPLDLLAVFDGKAMPFDHPERQGLVEPGCEEGTGMDANKTVDDGVIYVIPSFRISRLAKKTLVAVEGDQTVILFEFVDLWFASLARTMSQGSQWKN